MNCNLLSYFNNTISSYPSRQVEGYNTSSSPSFNGRAQEKLIKQLIANKNPKKFKLTFDEASRIYEHLGYDVMLKRGSHAIININGKNIPLVIPHKDKYISPFDVKRLKYVIAGDFEKMEKV